VGAQRLGMWGLGYPIFDGEARMALLGELGAAAAAAVSRCGFGD